jgi:hypothetical protein
VGGDVASERLSNSGEKKASFLVRERYELCNIFSFTSANEIGAYTISYSVPGEGTMVHNCRLTKELMNGQDLVTYINKKKW